MDFGFCFKNSVRQMQSDLSQISTEKRDYLSVQDALFKGMNVDEIFEKAKKYSEGRRPKAV
jgi:hypothetical protein